MEAHFRREIGQPEHRALQSHQFAFGQGGIQRLLAGGRGGEFLQLELQTQHLAVAADDAARRHAVGNQRHAGQLDHRHIHKGQRRGQAEHQGFVEGIAVVLQQGGHHAAFTVGGVLVGEVGHGRKGG